jgi:hypothetical protein
VNTAGAIVARDGTGSFAAGSIGLAGNLDLPSTASASVGVLTTGGKPFLHNFGTDNTFVGANAGNTTLTGTNNSAFGYNALRAATTGYLNSAFGYHALRANTTGYMNSALGMGALGANTTGMSNSAFGNSALSSITTGDSNAAFGAGTLWQFSSGYGNTVVGTGAGSALASGSENIYIGNATTGSGDESNTIRIGTTQTATYIAGIYGQTSGSGIAVSVNNLGKLGTTTSSRRYKEQITDMSAESDVLLRLRPVSFYYRPELDETHLRQYGLVAEEVAEVAPDLVAYDEDGTPQTVRYHFVNAMLLNEVQKQRRHIQDLEARLAALESALAGDR